MESAVPASDGARAAGAGDASEGRRMGMKWFNAGTEKEEWMEEDLGTAGSRERGQEMELCGSES